VISNCVRGVAVVAVCHGGTDRSEQHMLISKMKGAICRTRQADDVACTMQLQGSDVRFGTAIVDQASKEGAYRCTETGLQYDAG